MKPFSSLILLLFISLNSFSQQQFIEVTVSDTIHVNPNVFIYTILLKDMDESVYDEHSYKDQQAFIKNEKQVEVKRRKLYDSLKTALQQSGFKTLSESLGNAVMIGGGKTYAIKIITTTPDSIILLYDHIKNLESVSGYLLFSKAKDESSYCNMLYEKLITEAGEKAKKIAGISKLHLGAIISVTENKDNDKVPGGWSAYPPLSMLAPNTIPGWHTTVDEQQSTDNTYTIENSLTVRFVVE
jgi:hypothetical protein